MKINFIKKMVCTFLLSASLFGFSSIGASAETTQAINHYNQWVLVNGQWEYYNSLGQLMKDSWIKSFDGKYYYVDNNGIMLTNKWIDNYYVGVDGSWISNTTILKTNENTYVKNQVANIKETEEKKINNDDNIDNSTNKTISNESKSSSTSSTSDDYYDYSFENSNEEYVSGYYRKNGTYVKGHYRTKKDSTTSNNYSHKGNYNPHNGKWGYKN